MSDALIISLTTTFVAAFISLASPVLLWYLNKRTLKGIQDTKNEIVQTNTKVDEYHKEVNSKLSKLVVTEKALSFKEGAEEERTKNT